MGYLTKHIIKIIEPHTVKDLEKLRDVIRNISGKEFNIYAQYDCIDDRTWNGGDGRKWYNIYEDIQQIAKEYNDFPFTVWCRGEDGAQYKYTIKNGEIDYEDQCRIAIDDDFALGDEYVLLEGFEELEYDE